MISTTARRTGRSGRRETTTSVDPRRNRRSLSGALAPWFRGFGAAGCSVALAWTAPRSANPSASPRGAADGGRIEGAVVISRAIATRRPAFRIYSDLGPGSQPPKQTAPDSIGELKNVVLYLQTDPAHAAALKASGAAVTQDSMVQRNEQFVPHVLPVLVGSTVSFPNEDDVYHNVFSLSAAKTFEIKRIPKGAPLSETAQVFGAPGIVQVFCHIHSDMSGIIFVLDNPYFATPQPTGHYVIDGIPAGDYTLVAWHERIKTIVRRNVHVVAGQTTTEPLFNLPLPSGGQYQ
jgi:plastocyanin